MRLSQKTFFPLYDYKYIDFKKHTLLWLDVSGKGFKKEMPYLDDVQHE